MVVLVGSGLNMAARAGGTEAASSWKGLLGRVAEVLQEREVPPIGPLPDSTIAQWETMLRAVAETGGDASARAERILQNAVVKTLRGYERSAARHPLYGRALDWGVRDLISFNFDRSLVFAAGQRTMSHAMGPERRREVGRKRGHELSTDLSLYRHHRVERDAGPLRIWYPHGDTGLASTLKLGVHAYGRAIGALDESVRAYHHHRAQPVEGDWDDRVRTLPEGALSWPHQFLSAPLLYLGLGLSHEEWPLWWLLHRRARLHARRPAAQRPGAWALLCRKKTPSGLPPQLEGRPGGLEALALDSHAAVWDTVEELFAS